jgi:deoxyribonuclease-4
MYHNARILLGGHLSISEGFSQALIAGASINCSVVQIFTKSNRQWSAKPIDSHQAELFVKTRKNLGVATVIAHASYLINLGSGNPEIAQKSVAALIDEIERCHALEIPYLVLHPGSHANISLEMCLENIAQNINIALERTRACTTSIVLENMAGQGSVVCYSFEHLATILNKVTIQSRIGVCFDTCHAFAAGYNFNTQESYQSLWNSFNNTVGLGYLKVIHINDSKKACGSRVDRHEEIGQGMIGMNAFFYLMNDTALASVPKILETPSAYEGYPRNMKILTELMKNT